MCVKFITAVIVESENNWEALFSYRPLFKKQYPVAGNILTLYGTLVNLSTYEYHVPVLDSDCPLGETIILHYKGPEFKKIINVYSENHVRRKNTHFY